MTHRPATRQPLPNERHPATLFGPALNANFQGELRVSFGSPGKILSDLKSPQKVPSIFHRRRDSSKFASTLTLCRRSVSPTSTTAHVVPKQEIDPCELVLLKKLGGFGSAKHDRLIAHSARFDMFDDDDAKDTDDFPDKSKDIKRGLTSAQIAVIKEMSLRSHSNSLLNALDDKDSSVNSDAMSLWVEEILIERNRFASAHLFTKAKLRESMEKAEDHNTPTANETAILCCCFADMITSLSLTTDIKAELGQLWGRLMHSVFQNWDDSVTALLVSQAHEPLLKNDIFKKVINSCYQRHPYHDIGDKMAQDLTQTNIRLKQANAFLRHERKMYMERVEERDVQFDTICKLEKSMMWSEKLSEDRFLEVSTEVEALNMRARSLEEAAKRDQSQINSLQVEFESQKRQLSACLIENKALVAKVSDGEAAVSNSEILMHSLRSQVESLKAQLSASDRNNALLLYHKKENL